MKASLFYTGLISLCSMIFSSCGVGIPIQNKAPQNNDTYTISYLFEHDGVKVYRFYDMGVSGNLAVSMIRKVGLPTYEIQNKDYGYRKFNKKVHIMEQNP